VVVTNTNSGKTPPGAAAAGRYANWSHGRLGMDNYSTSSSATYPGRVVGSGSDGACVSCHVGPTGLHTFGAYEVAKATIGTSTTVGGCFGCHVGEDMEEVGDKEERPLFDRLMSYFQYTFTQLSTPVYFDNSINPYFFTAPPTPAGPNSAVTNWTAITPAGGAPAATMGAAMNLKLLAAEKGAHVHNRAYMRHLVFDSVQFLQTGKNTYSNSKFYATTGSTSLNDVLSFTNYSTYLTANPDNIKNENGTMVSISQLKGYIITSSSLSNPIESLAPPAGTGATRTYGAMKFFRR